MAKNSQKLLSFAVRKLGNFHEFAQSTSAWLFFCEVSEEENTSKPTSTFQDKNELYTRRAVMKTGGKDKGTDLWRTIYVFIQLEERVIEERIREEREEVEEEELFRKALEDEGFRRRRWRGFLRGERKWPPAPAARWPRGRLVTARVHWNFESGRGS